MIGPKSQWRFGYDSTTPEKIPRDAKMIFPYITPSEFAWTDKQIALFPDAIPVRITVHGMLPDWQQASIIDVEHGAFTPEQARKFVIRRNDFRPATATVYCNRATLPAVQAACHGLHWHLFLASPDGNPEEIPPIPNVVAKQFRFHGDWDESVVYDPTWHAHKADVT